MAVPGTGSLAANLFPQQTNLLSPQLAQQLITGSQLAAQAGTSQAQLLNTPLGIAMAPTLGTGGIDFQWSNNIIGAAGLIANGQIALPTTPKTGTEGIVSSATSGQTGIANRYLLQRLAKLDPDSPDALKLEATMLKLNGQSAEAKKAILQNRFERIQKFGSELNAIRNTFPAGSQDRLFLDQRINALSGLANNAQIEAFILANLGDEQNPDVRAKLLRESLLAFSQTPETPNDPAKTQATLANLAARIATLTQNSALGQQLLGIAQQWRNNNLAIATFQKAQADAGNALGSAANPAQATNPLEALLAMFTGQKPAAAAPAPSSSIFGNAGGDSLLGSALAKKSIF